MDRHHFVHLLLLGVAASSSLLNLVMAEPLFECTFDDDTFCGLTPGVPNWQQGTTTTIPTKTGSPNDKYAYISTKDDGKSYTDLLTSTLYPPGTYCLSYDMYFHRDGSAGGFFNIIVRSDTSSSHHTRSHNTNGWIKRRTPVHIINKNWRFIIEGFARKGRIVDIAVDNVRLDKGKCVDTNLG